MENISNEAYRTWKIYRDVAMKFTCDGCKDKKDCANCGVIKDEIELFNLIPEEIRKNIKKD